MIAQNWQTAVVSLPLLREPSGARVSNPAEISAACADMRMLAQECQQVFTLDAKNRIINRHMITLGLVNATLSHPREIFRPAITDGAAGIVLVHNHPSGDPTPSAEDVSITRKAVEAGKIVDIRVVDHVIIGRGERKYVSLREAGLVSFE